MNLEHSPMSDDTAFAADAQYLRGIIEHGGEAVFVIDPRTGKILDCNQQACTARGYSREELLGLSATDIEAQRSASELQAICMGLVPGHPITVEGVNKRRDGSTFPVELRLGLLVAAAGPLIIASARDTSERAQAEALLLASERCYRTLFEGANDGIALHDLDGRIVEVNGVLCERLGYSRDELLGMNVTDIRGSGAPGWDSQQRRRITSRGRAIFETTHRRKDGSTLAVEVSSCLIEDAGAQAVLSISRDITDRKRAEEALRESEAKYNRFFRTSRDCAFITSEEGHWIDLNDASVELFGYGSRDELLHVNIADLYAHSKDRAKHIALIAERGYTVDFPVELRRRDGTVVHALITSVPLCDEEGRLTGYQGTIRDVTERRKMEEELRQSEATLRAITGSARDAIIMLDGRGRVSFWNEAAERTLGWGESEALGRDLHELIAPGRYAEAYLAGMHRFATTGQGAALGQTTEFSARRKDGTELSVELSLSAVNLAGEWHSVGILRDITERKQAEKERGELERQLQESQKLESLGVLAGGIAHDFNNLLTTVLGNADLALAENSLPEPAKESLRDITHAAHRAAELCRQMLAYSGRGSFIVEPLDLSALVGDMLGLLRGTISGKAELRLDLEENLPFFQGDASQLSQVVMNLVINASESITGESGVIAISTSARACSIGDFADTYGRDRLAPGRYLILEVSDTGGGMDKDTQSRLFEPFFTTKFPGRGLGLSAVLGIVRGHQGALKLESAPGEGTTFRVFFPVAPGHVGPRSADNPTRGNDREASGGGVVLLVDDEASIRTLGARMLSRLGFQVLLAADGREALKLYGEHRREITFVLLDLTMPGMDGRETFEKLRQIDPDVRVVMSSGYTEEEIGSRFAGEGLAGFVQKPYTLDHLKEGFFRFMQD
jgi:PAS domain S-box-containing protein